MKKTPTKKKPYNHAPAFTRAELARLKSLADVAKFNAWDKVVSVSHITPRAFCVAKTRTNCAVFAVPTCDREPQVSQSHYTTVQHKSCADVQTGDWCAIAYVMTQSSGQPVVLEILQPAKP
jgi:hypothetical protein